MQGQDVDIEYVVVDGASTDGSLEIARSLKPTENIAVKIVSEPDGGVYEAMNKGVKLAKGRYLYFLGAGDTLHPGSLQEVQRRLPFHDCGFLYGDVIYKGERYDGIFDRAKLSHQNICHQSIFYGREVFGLCGEYNLRYRRLADWEMNMRCFSDRNISKSYMDFVVANFEEGGMSHLGDTEFDRDQLDLIRRYLGLQCYWNKRWPAIEGALKEKFQRVRAKFVSHRKVALKP